MLDIERVHRAILAASESGLRYAIDEGKYLEAASLIVEADLRLSMDRGTSDLLRQAADLLDDEGHELTAVRLRALAGRGSDD